ncbi:putative signal peptide protein [Puccinia sorghi]|uniref:Putative signal peptide protein n=1 Tax=Puccinia sorghi TaxID=27349 RepID=A0A0L6UE54_9BASI|nr:putative signal peptide protein [Puccinia sorghi]
MSIIFCTVLLFCLSPIPFCFCFFSFQESFFFFTSSLLFCLFLRKKDFFNKKTQTTDVAFCILSLFFRYHPALSSLSMMFPLSLCVDLFIDSLTYIYFSGRKKNCFMLNRLCGSRNMMKRGGVDEIYQASRSRGILGLPQEEGFQHDDAIFLGTFLVIHIAISLCVGIQQPPSLMDYFFLFFLFYSCELAYTEDVYQCKKKGPKVDRHVHFEGDTMLPPYELCMPKSPGQIHDEYMSGHVQKTAGHLFSTLLVKMQFCFYTCIQYLYVHTQTDYRLVLSASQWSQDSSNTCLFSSLYIVDTFSQLKWLALISSHSRPSFYFILFYL